MPSIIICPSYLATTRYLYGRYTNWTSIAERCEREQSAPNVNYDPSFAGHDPAEHLFIEAMFPIEEFFADCAFNKQVIQCSEMFEFVTIPGGSCYKIRDLPDFKMAEPRGDDGFSLLINLHQEYAQIPITNSGGVYIMAYEPGTGTPSYHYNVIYARPGQNQFIGLEKHVRKLLPKPYNPVDCEMDEKYSEGKCLNDCLYREYWGYRDCTGERIEDSTCTVCDLVMRVRSQIKCNCPIACKKIEYKMTNLGNFKFPSTTSFDNYWNWFYPNTSSSWGPYILKENILDVQIYYKTLEVTEVTQTPTLTWFQVLSDLGGALGLCLGASVVTAFEFAEFFCEVVVGWVKKIRKARVGESADAKESTEEQGCGNEERLNQVSPF